MAKRPLRPCGRPGCSALVRPPARYCQAHQDTPRQQQVAYDRYVRPRHIVEFYRGRQWQAARLQALIRDNYLCQQCLRQGRITPATIVHHLVEVREDWSRRLALDNLESICHACHNAVHG